MPDYSHESAHGGRVAGLDEAGRGPLAGPVLAAAVLFLAPPPRALAKLIDDSKKLTAARREAAFAALSARADRARPTGSASPTYTGCPRWCRNRA
ncbi:hypothetical protein J4558_10540 [Leptolyngbya sp. 15MV]|nr:hypothetical protein J4558_10540 [Leptolyngbya sp. 15MV]